MPDDQRMDPIALIARNLVSQAISLGASHLLIEPGKSDIAWRALYRSEVRTQGTLPIHLQHPLTAFCKAEAGVHPSRRDVVQRGHFVMEGDSNHRTIPTIFTPGAFGESTIFELEDIPYAFSRPSQRMTVPEGVSPIVDILTEHSMRGRDVLGIESLSQREILLVLDVAARLKANKFDGTQTAFAQGQTLVMLFEKPSLRTRVTFEAGMTQLGGHAIYLEGRLGVRETVPDVAHNLERWVDGIMARTFDHKTVTDLAANATIPVINGLSDREHPCQAFADFQTIAEHKDYLQGLTLTYVGDGNNVAHSLMLLAAKVGTHFRLACPAGYLPDPELWSTALREAEATGAKLTLTQDPREACLDADVIYTDVWASMGQEEETAARAKAFADFQVNSELVSLAKPDAIVMHCLPAHRGEEITSEVLDGPQSVVFDQAENRLHAQKALLALVL